MLSIEPYTNLPVHLESEYVVNPMGFIQHFFNDEMYMPDASKMLNLWLWAAFDDSMPLTKKQMMLLMGFHDMFISLVDAAYILYQADDNTLSQITIPQEGDTNLIDEQYYYIDPYNKYKPWHLFPRHLSRKEYINPVIALEKFFNWKPLEYWHQFLADIFSAAVSQVSIFSATNEENLWVTCQHLFKLLETTHLIKVRLQEDSVSNSVHDRF